MKIDKEIKKLLLWFIICAIVGFLCVTLPPYFVGIKKYYDSPLFPYIRTAIENQGGKAFKVSFIMLFIEGIFIGILRPKYWLLLSVATISIFSITSIVEGIYDSSSHNLIPFEFVIYTFFSIPVCLGALISKFIINKFRKKMKDESSM